MLQCSSCFDCLVLYIPCFLFNVLCLKPWCNTYICSYWWCALVILTYIYNKPITACLLLQHNSILGSVFADFYDQQLPSIQASALSQQVQALSVSDRNQSSSHVFPAFSFLLLQGLVALFLSFGIASWSSSTWWRPPSALTACTTRTPPSITPRLLWWVWLATATLRTRSSLDTVAMATSPTSFSQVLFWHFTRLLKTCSKWPVKAETQTLKCRTGRSKCGGTLVIHIFLWVLWQ